MFCWCSATSSSVDIMPSLCSALCIVTTKGGMDLGAVRALLAPPLPPPAKGPPPSRLADRMSRSVIRPIAPSRSRLAPAPGRQHTAGPSLGTTGGLHAPTSGWAGARHSDTAAPDVAVVDAATSSSHWLVNMCTPPPVAAAAGSTRTWHLCVAVRQLYMTRASAAGCGGSPAAFIQRVTR